jgi:hypothetical protein
MAQLSLVLPIVFVMIAFGLWFVYGRDDHVFEFVDFYPPKGYNSAEVAFIYKGAAEDQDVVSLLIYLANKGYISITDTEEKVLFASVDGYMITKLKEYDGDNPNERIFLNGLFQSKSGDTKQQIRAEDLKNNFYRTINTITANINKKENRETIFEKDSLNKRVYLIIMGVVTFLLITVRPIIDYYGDFSMLFVLIFPAAGFTLLFLGLFTKALNTVTVNGQPAKSPRAGLYFGLFFGLLFGGIPFVALVLPALLLNTVYWVTFVVGMICFALLFPIDKYMKKRTLLGNEMLEKIKCALKTYEDKDKWRKLIKNVMESDFSWDKSAGEYIKLYGK